jgi:hypothetical protein
MQGLQDGDALEDARYAVMKASYEVKLLLAEIAHKRFDPSQPRVPSGNSDGGQWTATGGSREGRVQVAQRAPVRRDPHNFGARRDNSGPRIVPIKIAGRTEWVTTAQANQYHSSYALAQSMTNLARRFNQGWRPESTIVGNVAGQIAANNATAAQAVRFIQRYGLNGQSNMPTMSIVAPGGRPIGTVTPRAKPHIRTISRREMEVVISQLLHNARHVERPNHNGIVFQRADGVFVTVRESYRNGITIDLRFPNMRNAPVSKIHVFNDGKSVDITLEKKIMDDVYPYPAIKKVRLVDFDVNEMMGDKTFLQYCQEQVEDPARAEAEDLAYDQGVLSLYFENDIEKLEQAMRYFLGYIMSRGYAPMNFANARGMKYEYGPITKYGLRPQEIIDNIIADWRSRNYAPFEPYEVMFGWEHDCGLFMQDDPE